MTVGDTTGAVLNFNLGSAGNPTAPMINHEQLSELLQSRRSVRRFRAEAPSRALIERVIQSAVTAPSATFTSSDWPFTVLAFIVFTSAAMTFPGTT